jgi:hypothetical protein
MSKISIFSFYHYTSNTPQKKEKTKFDTGKTLKRLASATGLALLGAYATKNLQTKKGETKNDYVLLQDQSKAFCTYLNTVIEKNETIFETWNKELDSKTSESSPNLPTDLPTVNDILQKQYFFSPQKVKDSLDRNFDELIKLLKQNPNMIPVLVIPSGLLRGQEGKLDLFFSLLFLKKYKSYTPGEGNPKPPPIEHAFIGFQDIIIYVLLGGHLYLKIIKTFLLFIVVLIYFMASMILKQIIILKNILYFYELLVQQKVAILK